MPDQLFESKAAAVVLKSFLEAKKQEEIARRDKANVRLDIYHDDWGEILEKALAGQFIKKNYDKIRLLKNTTQNIFKKVINDVSVVYKVAPTRDYGKNETIKDIYEYLDIDEFMKQCNRYGTALNDVLLRVGWDEDTEKITLDLQTPANTSVIQRDGYPQQAAAIYYEIEYIDSEFKVEMVNVFWSDFEHFLFNEKGDVRPPAEDNPEMINPYGKLPFVIVHMNQLPGMFWNPTEGSDIVDGTIITGFKRTLKDHLFKHQSFKQLWFRSQKGDVAPEMASDPLSAFLLTGENSEVGVLDLIAQFNEMEQSLQADINAFLATYGLSIDMFAVSGEEASGKALNIKNRGLREIRETQLPVFRRVEGELFEMIRLVYNTYKGENAIPKSLKFKIDFAELEIYVEPMDKRKQCQWDVQNGVLSPGQFFMKFNPDIVDEKEAEKRMAANLKKYKDMRNQGFSFDKFFNTITGEMEPEAAIGEAAFQDEGKAQPLASTPGRFGNVK